MSTQFVIHHDESAKRFITTIEDQDCFLEYKDADEHTWEFFHTFVPESLRHHGIAAKLAEFALTFAKQHHKKITPTCSYVMNFIAKNKRFRDLVD